MAEQRLEQKVVAYLQDAQAMERSVLVMLNSMIFSTGDPKLVELLRRHQRETQEHERRLSARLSALGARGSLSRQLTALGPTMVKGVLDQLRGDKPSNNARDGFITEQLEIATYELLERVADRAGDTATASIARTNRADEERMASAIAANWDRAVELTLAADGIRAQRARRTAARRPRARRRRAASAAPTGARRSRARSAASS